ncbi:hypothetical protein Prudu_001553 [Prunus dulcis]|uniref:Transposable element protein n=1 Tax=Prunus dulcis TaxID=3755 RepID=A0A4Y1QNR9_PRUDU|nr:hypothetical protein Prudu_001553 [Prunus dulcis]
MAENLSGSVVKGYKACPIYSDDTPSHRLKNGHKICYIGHRKWLPINHPYRRQRAAFNGKPKYGTPPEPLNGEEVLRIVEDINYIWGSKNGEVLKKSKFFDIEYCKYLHVRHVLDVMHIEKNVCDSIIGTLLEIPGKNKDGIAARLDLLNKGVKIDLQPKYGERRTRLPLGPWNLSRAEKRAVCNSFYGMKVPEDSRLLGLKSHDCHTLMQQLLPMAIRSVFEKPTRYAITRLCFFINAICAKTVDVSKLDKLEEDEHMIHIKTTYPKFRKRTKWLQDKHNSTFIQWLHFKVQSELNGEEHNGVSENLRWLAAGPSMAVPSYRSYLINGVKFNTKAQDDVRTVQNSGVYLLAYTMQVASAKDKNPLLSPIWALGMTNQTLKTLG